MSLALHPGYRSAPPRSLLRGDHLEAAGAGSAEAIRPVHVLHVGLRQHVLAGRDRAHHVGDGEHRIVLVAAVERGAEAVVAELRVDWLLAVLDPAERAGIARRDEMRVVDLEAGRGVV